jgi:hypothetical protein
MNKKEQLEIGLEEEEIKKKHSTMGPKILQRGARGLKLP